MKLEYGRTLLTASPLLLISQLSDGAGNGFSDH